MKTLNPYINFSGKCREALEFYRGCFGGEFSILTYDECSEQECGEEPKDNIMHAEFSCERIHFMATDGQSGENPVCGDNIHLSINFTDEKEQEQVFKLLARGGKITMPLADMFWDARFGMLTDRYGINWMFNCQKHGN